MTGRRADLCRAWETFMSAHADTVEAARNYDDALLREQAAWAAYQSLRAVEGHPEVTEPATGPGGASNAAEQS